MLEALSVLVELEISQQYLRNRNAAICCSLEKAKESSVFHAQSSVQDHLRHRRACSRVGTSPTEPLERYCRFKHYSVQAYFG